MEINLQNEILKREQLIEQNEDKKHRIVELKTLVESARLEISALIEQIDNFNADEILSEIKIIKGIMEQAETDQPKAEEKVAEIVEEEVEQVEAIAEEIVEEEVEQVEEIVAEEIPVAIPEEQPKEIEPPKPQVPKIRPFPFRR